MEWKGIECYINTLHKRLLKRKITKRQYERYTLQLVLWDMQESQSLFNFEEDDECGY